MKSHRMLGLMAGMLFVLFAFTALSLTGCTVHTNGMTLPNPYYYKNRPQYFPRGPEFPFTNEAATLQNSEQGSMQSRGF